MKKTKRRLKKWVKVTLGVIAGIITMLLLVLVLKQGTKNINDMYEACDNVKGYTCSYYEARLYSIRGE